MLIEATLKIVMYYAFVYAFYLPTSIQTLLVLFHF